MQSLWKHRPNGKRRVSVEVYFVLYLTAIILLLGTSPLSQDERQAELEEAITELIDTDFEVDVEKIAMVLPYVPAGELADTMQSYFPRDTVNIVRAHGRFSSVEFRLVSIVDTSTGDNVKLEKGTLSSDSDSSVSFHWRGSNGTGPAVYQVAVAAEARPIVPDEVRSTELRERIEEVVRRRAPMRDTARFSVSIVPASDVRLATVRNAPGIESSSADSLLAFPFGQLPSILGSSGFSVMPTSGSSTGHVGGSWRNEIFVAGADARSVTMSGPPDVRVVSRRQNYIELSGRVNTEGLRDVTLEFRTPSGERATTSFIVTGTKLDAPGIPNPIYSGESYSMDFSTGGIDEGRISVKVLENDRTLPGKENLGPVFSYTPSDGADKVEFIRYVDGQRYDSEVRRIADRPKPVVRMSEESDSRVVFETISYGTHEGAPNLAVLRVVRGNAKVAQEIRSEQRIDAQTGRNYQRWVVQPERSSEDFSFTVQAWDQRGKSMSTSFRYEQ